MTPSSTIPISMSVSLLGEGGYTAYAIVPCKATRRSTGSGLDVRGSSVGGSDGMVDEELLGEESDDEGEFGGSIIHHDYY